ncbi:MAG: DUF3472 domain-containing protein [Gemmatimonadaceae bacterium]|nr:DUF3472 domain-containing protein [Gemmatimonadaceae bacterium]
MTRFWMLLLAAAARLAPTSAAAQPAAPVADSALVVPAYTAYLHPDADGAPISPRRPVAPFTQPGRALQWYALLRHPGDLQLQVATHGASGRWQITVGRDTRTGRISATRGDTTVIDFGTVTIRDTGYVAIVLTAAAPTPASIDALLLRGPAAADAHANREPRRNAASVHLRYPTDSTWPITGFYSEVTAVDDPVTTYYMATGFARGYFGMQVNSPTERRIIFSVWDAAEGQTAMNRSTVAEENRTSLLGKGEGVVAEAFGNEGTGGHSHLVYPWKTGSVQRFFVTAKPVGTATEYRGYWYHPERQQWMLIAGFRAPKDGGYLRRLYAFSENFGGSTGDLRRKARYGNQWVQLADGSWRALTQATFTHDPTGKEARLDRWAGVENGQFFLSHGGFVAGFAPAGTMLTRPAGGAPPTIEVPPGV